MEGNSIKSYENLCKIFEMRIRLDREKRIDTPEDVLINYEKYCKRIDNFYNEAFEQKVRKYITPAPSLEEEQDRLTKLINILDERLEAREKLENRFYQTTGKYITGFQMIVSLSELNEKKDRLEVIEKYLTTNKEIDSITESIAKLKNTLDEEITKKTKYEEKNKIMEDELYLSFMDAATKDEYFKDALDKDVEIELENALNMVTETGETLSVTRDSVKSLINTGMSDDYTSYVEDAEKSFYIWKNREIILKIYEIVSDKSNDFNELSTKRENIDTLIRERKSERLDLNINTNDEFEEFSNLLTNQIDSLKDEKEILENISNYDSRIKFKEERLDELVEENNSIEVLEILREYNLIETYDEPIEELELPLAPVEEEIIEEEESVINEVIDPYRIVEIKDYPRTLNIGLAKLKGESVRDKVNKKLNPKEKEESYQEVISKMPSLKDEKQEEIKEEKLPVWDSPKEEKNQEAFINPEVPVWDDKQEEKPKEESIISEVPAWNSKNIDTKVKNILPSEETKENINVMPQMQKIAVPEEKETTPAFTFPSNIPEAKAPAKEEENLFWSPSDIAEMQEDKFPKINLPSSGNFNFPDLNN